MSYLWFSSLQHLLLSGTGASLQQTAGGQGGQGVCRARENLVGFPLRFSFLNWRSSSLPNIHTYRLPHFQKEPSLRFVAMSRAVKDRAGLGKAAPFLSCSTLQTQANPVSLLPETPSA